MASPFVYVAPGYSPNPYMTTSQPSHVYTPFIPDATFYSPHSSPYHHPGSLPPSPRLHTTSLHHTPPSGYMHLAPDYVRPRTTSYHSSPGPAFLNIPATSPSSIGHQRRHSFGGTPGQAPISLPPGWPPIADGTPHHGLSPYGHQPAQNTPIVFHPWLNGEFARAEFYLNLADPRFYPQKIQGGRTAFLTADELSQPATHPPVSSMRILVDRVPQWPIELAWNPQSVPDEGRGGVPPITIGDVLTQIHRGLHQRIAHRDWDDLSRNEGRLVSRAFARRCATMGVGEATERTDGVKRVDFLVDQIMFKGLVRTQQPGVYQVITG